MEYVLHPRQSPPSDSLNARLVPSRPSRNLRRGGGRKSSIGWTEQKRRTNRRRFDELRPFIKTGVTVIYPSNATSTNLAKLSRTNQEFCKESGIPARSVWEGPGYHEHIALGIEHAPEIERKWVKRLAKRWRAVFGTEMRSDAFYWNPAVEPDKIASYLSKTWSKGRQMIAKGSCPWMTFSVSWETGFRKLLGARAASPQRPGKPREKRGKSQAETNTSPNSPPVSPSYTVSHTQTPEKKEETPTVTLLRPKSDIQRQECPICWRRWGRSFWAGSCKCSPSFPDC